MAGLYIHIPLCRRKCLYCDFYSCTREELKAPLLEAIVREMELRRGFLGQEPLNTIYIGGGTPSLLTPAELGRLIAAARRLWECSRLQEVTVEVNPDDVDEDYLHELAAVGVERLSIGVQSFADRDLRLMGRRHDAHKARRAVLAAHRAGFTNISIDLIYGIPGMSAGDWQANLREAVSLGVQHISAYHLTIEEGTPLGTMAARGEFSAVGETVSRSHFDLLRAELSAAGYEHYEISNFALPGFRAVHNSAYWSGGHYLGTGPSAHSFNGEVRSWSVADIERYIEGGDIYQSETLSAVDRYNEYVMTSLRRIEGADGGEVRRRFGEKMAQYFEKCACGEVEAGLLRHEGERYFIDGADMLLSNRVISALFFV